MADDATATTVATTTATTAATATDAPWHAAITDPELKGYVENRGLAAKTPLEAFLETAKAHRAAEAHLGVPADRLLRLPADQNPDAWKDVWGRLGASDKADDYDLSSVKFADGKDLDPEFASFFKATAAANHIPKEAAVKLAAEFTRYVEKQSADEATAAQRADEAAREALKRNWGQNYDANLDVAKRAMQTLKPTEEQIDAAEKAFGFDKVLELFRSLGEKMGEDSFVEGGAAGSGIPRTVDGAKERMDALMSDQDFMDRMAKGGTKENEEFWALHKQANPEVYRAAAA
jgi:hypothetical protein